MMQHYSQYPKGGRNPNIHQQIMDKRYVICIYEGILFSLKKGRNADMLPHDEP